MDVVICVSSKDCLIVKKTVFYIHRNIGSDNIYIITDKHSFGFFSKRFRSRYNVSLVDEEEIVADRRQLEAIAGRHFTCEYRFGWYYQQFLKMEFARSRYAKDYYLIWDSDTIPLNRLSFFTSNKMIFTPKTEYHEPYFRTMQALVGYDKATDYSFIAEHMLVSVSIMKELIRWKLPAFRAIHGLRRLSMQLLRMRRMDFLNSKLMELIAITIIRIVSS